MFEQSLYLIFNDVRSQTDPSGIVWTTSIYMAYRKLVSQEQELLSPQLAQAVRAFHQNTGHQWDDADQHQLQLWHFSTRKYSAVTGAAPLSKSKALSSLLLSFTCARVSEQPEHRTVSASTQRKQSNKARAYLSLHVVSLTEQLETFY